jgi:predicted MFS family arabinose efflux permease
VRKRVQCYLQVGRRPEFRRFWLGMMISRAGDAFTTVALSWVVLDIAGPFQLGVVLMCFGLPRIVSGPVAGRLLDRSSPRVLLMADNAARGLLLALVPVLLWSHHLAVADLYGIAAVCALLSAVTEVAEVALVPRLVDDAQLDTANSLLSANWELAYIVGPALAGLIVATIGAPFALGFDAVSFTVMAVICLGLPSSGPVSRASPAQAGLRRSRLSLRSFPAVLVLSCCGFGMLFLDGVATVLYPEYCRSFLHAGAAGYGILVSAAGAGALLGVFAGPGLYGRLPPARRIGTVIAAGAPLFGLLRLAPDLAVAVVLLGLAAFAWGPYYVFERTLVQRLVPDDIRSRLAGTKMMISSLGFPLGSAIGGALVGAIGVPAVVLAIACAYLPLSLLPLLAPGLRGLGPAHSWSESGLPRDKELMPRLVRKELPV